MTNQREAFGREEELEVESSLSQMLASGLVFSGGENHDLE